MSAYNYASNSYANRRDTVNVTLKKKDLLFDMDATTHLLSEAEKAQATAKQADIIASDSTEVFGLRVLARYLETRAAQLSEVLNSFIPCEFASDPETETDELSLTTESEIDYEFKVSIEFNTNNLPSIAKLMHEYVVDGALVDWYRALGINKGQDLPARLAELEVRMKNLFLSRDIPEITL